VLAFLHGLSGSSRWFAGVVPLLGERDVRLLDLPRFGRRFAPDAAADWVAEQLEPDAPVDLVGHSLGGLVAATVAAQRPELVRTLVLVAPVGAPHDAPPARTLARYGTALARTVAAAPLALLRTVAADALRWGPEAIVRGGLWVAGASFAGEVRAPTLLVWGDQDVLVPVEQAEAWRELVPHARLRLVPDAGHVPMVEAPSAFAQLLLDFLRDPGDGAGMRPVDGVRGPGDDDEAAARRE
jgi:pimeloyl-ACP methyl ester carboxylesterase